MYYLLDDNGYYLGVNSKTPFEVGNQTNVPINGNFVKFKFDGDNWVEGASAEEINSNNISNLPLEVSLWKLRFVLSEMQLEDLITSAIEQLPEPHKKAATYIWNYGNSIDRFSSTISFIQDHLGLSENQVNEIFIQANSITL